MNTDTTCIIPTLGWCWDEGKKIRQNLGEGHSLKVVTWSIDQVLSFQCTPPPSHHKPLPKPAHLSDLLLGLTAALFPLCDAPTRRCSRRIAHTLAQKKTYTHLLIQAQEETELNLKKQSGPAGRTIHHDLCVSETHVWVGGEHDTAATDHSPGLVHARTHSLY